MATMSDIFDQEPTPELSERELQVLAKLASGASNKQIADELIISIHTVKVHVRNIYSKLGVQSRTEAAMRAIQDGLIFVPVANVITNPEPIAIPEIQPEPIATPEIQPELTAIPEIQPELTATPEIQPEPIATPEIQPEPIATPEIQPELTAIPEIQPELTAILEIQPELTAIPEIQQPEIEDNSENDIISSPEISILPHRPTRLALWQQFYFALATLLAVVVAIVPVLPTSQNNLKPVVGSFPKIRIPTPTPPAPKNWSFKATLLSPRASLGLVSNGQKIFAIGGVVSRDNQATRLVEIYDPATNRWTEGNSKPTATANIQGALLADRIYVPGGCNELGEASNILEIYDPSHDNWTTGTALPEPRCAYGLVPFKDKLYLFGGWDGQAFVDTVLMFWPKENRWELLNSRLPHPSGYVGTAVLSNTIYMAGGYDGQQEFAETYIFDPQTGDWRAKKAMQHRRSGLGLVAGANRIYAIGGGRLEPLTTSEEYDPKTDTWTDFTTPFAISWRDMAVATLDNSLYAAGGLEGWEDSEQKFMDTVVAYQFIYRFFLPISRFQN